MNNIYIPSWHYRAPGIVQRTWGWSPVEEMILLSLDRSPGTINDVSQTLKNPATGGRFDRRPAHAIRTCRGPVVTEACTVHQQRRS